MCGAAVGGFHTVRLKRAEEKLSQPHHPKAGGVLDRKVCGKKRGEEMEVESIGCLFITPWQRQPIAMRDRLPIHAHPEQLVCDFLRVSVFGTDLRRGRW